MSLSSSLQHKSQCFVIDQYQYQWHLTFTPHSPASQSLVLSHKKQYQKPVTLKMSDIYFSIFCSVASLYSEKSWDESSYLLVIFYPAFFPLHMCHYKSFGFCICQITE